MRLASSTHIAWLAWQVMDSVAPLPASNVLTSEMLYVGTFTSGGGGIQAV